jgi:hypothetical protein
MDKLVFEEFVMRLVKAHEAEHIEDQTECLRRRASLAYFRPRAEAKLTDEEYMAAIDEAARRLGMY